MVRIGFMPSEEISFENVDDDDGRTDDDDDGRTDDYDDGRTEGQRLLAYTISSPVSLR